MLETGRRTVISTSQLGLYSDHGDRYHRSRYSSITRKLAIGVMVVVTVILVGIFLYDFASASSVNSKLNQETKHMYILQNALKKPSNLTKKSLNSTVSPEVNRTSSIYIQDRLDNDNYGNPFLYDDTGAQKVTDAELRSQNLDNFKLRKRVLKSVESKVDEAAEGKQLFDNHAIVYRVRHRHKYPESEEDESSEESRPTPFHWELKTPQPTSFKRPRYPQLTQYRYPHASRNIQDIIKYLTSDADLPNRGIKFTGVYVNPKKYDLYPEAGEMMSNSDRSEEEEGSPYQLNEDPFYRYKPKHPADVNLLATSNVRFSPTGLHRYNYDAYGRPSSYYKPTSMESMYENPMSYPSNYGKKRKPQPFSVMLDIYPITDIVEQNKKGNRPKQVPMDDYELKRPLQYNRGPKFYPSPPQSMTGMPNQPMTEEEERQQMIFHLNLYPRKKNKMSRYDVLQRSESMAPDERRQFVDKVWSPLETIAKHLAVEQSKFMDTEKPNDAATRYQETLLDNKDEEAKHETIHPLKQSLDDDQEEAITVLSNHKSSNEEDYASTEKYDYEAQRIVATTTESECDDCGTTTISKVTNVNKTKSNDDSKDIDTVEGFKQFSDSVS
ncbi:hypothetical protein WN48_01451 [Eufriesea mexicana]|uniref:uncharacterized protein LOC108547964 n=1 Tax=Eufriesea mexicana TaxID=516756 RepID=UPI00083C0047|nr:PREDICTED: uncharacterized protein LOC108547964 [Eufriesea mexicana]OAD57756.1 hypothetical protein WN48_01451 [Eufriesea mexicana]